MNSNDKIAVLGSNGLVGSSLTRTLKKHNYTNLILKSRSNGLNLLNYSEVENFFKTEKPNYVFMVAGLVGGIKGNQSRNADFLYENVTMIMNVLRAMSIHSKDTKILYTGSSCIYPKDNPLPIKEERLLMGPLEKTNLGYAIAKITGIIGCQLYKEQYGINAIAVMPSNMYGPNDTYDLETGHMIPSLIKKFIDAKNNNLGVKLWGSGEPRREALFVDDCSEVCIHLMNTYNDSKIVNVGTGFDYSIKEFADIIGEVINYAPELTWDTSKPDGVIKKNTDITLLRTLMPHFKPTTFEEGLKITLKADFGIDLKK